MFDFSSIFIPTWDDQDPDGMVQVAVATADAFTERFSRTRRKVYLPSGSAH